MTDLILIASIGIPVLGLIAWAVLKHFSENTRHELFLSEQGFRSCPEDVDGLLERILSLERNEEYTYTIKDLYRCSAGESKVHFYQKHRVSRPGDLYTIEEFLVPFPRKSPLPCLLYLKPSSLKEGLATRFIRTLASTSWDAQPDDLVNLERSKAAQESNILSVFGPEGKTLHDLLDPEQIDIIEQGGNCGILVARFNEGYCSLEYMCRLPGADLKNAWQFIQALLKAGLDPDHMRERETGISCSS